MGITLQKQALIAVAANSEQILGRLQDSSLFLLSQALNANRAPLTLMEKPSAGSTNTAQGLDRSGVTLYHYRSYSLFSPGTCMSDLPFNILLVDDDSATHTFVKRALSDAPCTVDMALNAAEARDRIHASAPQLLLLDIGLPGKGGLEFLQELKEEE